MKQMFGCGHYTLTNTYESLSIDGKRDYIKWKYTVGSNGTKTYCFDCFLRKGVELK